VGNVLAACVVLLAVGTVVRCCKCEVRSGGWCLQGEQGNRLRGEMRGKKEEKRGGRLQRDYRIIVKPLYIYRWTGR